MIALRQLLIALLLLGGAPAAAQQATVSARPDRVAVTLYRDPERDAERAMDLSWLNGFALVSEVRTIRIPAGDVELRFEGVAANILPQSAVVSGLPEGLLERNYDAYLLSPSTLIERSLGRRVHLRRTAPGSGRVTEQEAIVRSGANGALVLQTAEGFEALRCTGQSETITYDGVPEGLSARPTLSIRTRSARAVTATITLSYLASGFDWQANYVASLSPDGRRMELFAWLTLANGDETSFANASTQAVAGRVNHEVAERRGRIGSGINLRCWPQDTTSNLPFGFGDGEEIVVTGTRIGGLMAPPPPPAPAMRMADAAMEARQEELGDLKLYRIPEPVTVASNSQKQVIFLRRADVAVETLYRQQIFQQPLDWTPARRILTSRNREQEGLGVPLPQGRLVAFATGRARPVMIGEGTVSDRAIGEDVEVELGPAPGVYSRMTVRSPERRENVFEITVTNDQPRPIRYQAILPYQNVQSATVLGRRNGMPLWDVTVPANGTATLEFRPGR